MKNLLWEVERPSDDERANGRPSYVVHLGSDNVEGIVEAFNEVARMTGWRMRAELITDSL